MRRWFKWASFIVISPVVLAAAYLFFALLGGLLPGSLAQPKGAGQQLQQPVYLATNFLHADIAIPINTLSLKQFAFLREAGIPLDNPELRYLLIGWGSKAFYTTTKDYADIRPHTVWRAATGDNSVMHVAPAGDLSQHNEFVQVAITEAGFARMLAFILNTFERTKGKPVLIEGATFGHGDVFYASPQHFNILYPCNVWVSEALHEAGLARGLWTPTTYSLMLNYYLYN
ncbi:MAG: TIGR02117 family protein [Pseudomonadota bacterium]